MLMPIQISTATWIGLRIPSQPSPRVPVDVEVVADEPGPVHRPSAAPVPAARVEQRDVAGADLHAGFRFPGFEVGAPHRHSRIEPVDALELRDAVEDGTSGDAARRFLMPPLV